MDSLHFDNLTRRVAWQSSRRAAFAALAGGMLLLVPAASDAEASTRAKRRKRKQKRLRRKHGASANGPFGLKPISIWVYNPNPYNVSIEHGDIPARECCRQLNSTLIAPRERLEFNSSRGWAYVWIDGKYWINFANPALETPDVTAAFGGQPTNARWCCRDNGTMIVDARPLNPHQTTTIVMNNRTFNIQRNRDSNYKVFTITLPEL